MEKLANRQVLILGGPGIATTTSYDVSQFFRDFLSLPTLVVEAVENSGSADCDVTVEASVDGVVFSTVLAFTTLTASGTEPKALPMQARYMQITVTLSAAGDWDVNVYAIAPMANAQGALLP